MEIQASKLSQLITLSGLIRLILMRRNQPVLSITAEQRDELRKWATSRTLPAGDVFRSRLIVALAEGQSYRQTKASLNTTAPTISPWKQRFEEAGIAGLAPRHQGSRPRVANAAMQAKIVCKTQQRPADGPTHWSCRKMAADLGLSKSTVQHVWAQTRLKPHRPERYMASNDRHFETKATDIIGLYLNPPQHTAVFCMGPPRPGVAALTRTRRTPRCRILSPTERCHCMPHWTSRQAGCTE
jgi:Homeodomain-like domain